MLASVGVVLVHDASVSHPDEFMREAGSALASILERVAAGEQPDVAFGWKRPTKAGRRKSFLALALAHLLKNAVEGTVANIYKLAPREAAEFLFARFGKGGFVELARGVKRALSAVPMDRITLILASWPSRRAVLGKGKAREIAAEVVAAHFNVSVSTAKGEQ